MKATCWFHTVHRPAPDGGWQPSETVIHDFTEAEASRLLELFSNGDWEDGPRCLRQILDGDDGKPLESHRWLPVAPMQAKIPVGYRCWSCYQPQARRGQAGEVCATCGAGPDDPGPVRPGL